jgi:hypothetical protein
MDSDHEGQADPQSARLSCAPCAKRVSGRLTAAGLTGHEQARVFKEALPAMLRLLRRRATTFVARVTAGADVEIIEWHKYVRNQS